MEAARADASEPDAGTPLLHPGRLIDRGASDNGLEQRECDKNMKSSLINNNKSHSSDQINWSYLRNGGEVNLFHINSASHLKVTFQQQSP
jgi:hypothetical protein